MVASSMGLCLSGNREINIMMMMMVMMITNQITANIKLDLFFRINRRNFYSKANVVL